MLEKIKEIRGSVFIDENCNRNRDTGEKGIKDAIIHLYQVDERPEETVRGNGEEIRILRERLIAKTKTNSNGEFLFLVRCGTYSLDVDVESLPEGKGAVETSRLIEATDRGVVDFAVRDIAVIELGHGSSIHASLEEEFALNLVARDAGGHILSGRLKVHSDNAEVVVHRSICKAAPRDLKGRQARIVVSAGTVRKQISMYFAAPNLCTTSKINLAYRIGIIDWETKIHHYISTLTDRKRLPGEFHSTLPIKCGSRMVEEIKRYAFDKSAREITKREAERFVISPVPALDQVYTSPGGFFSIHYTLKGEHAAAQRDWKSGRIPPYIKKIGEVMDHVKKVTCEEKGFRMPVLDPGRSTYDVYVYNLEGIYGITFSSKYYTDPQNRARTASSFISLDNNYSCEKGFDKSRDDCMKVTAAHEFFHAVQYAYNVDADMWWKEASATWSEDELYDGINDYVRYLESFFSSPYKPLDENTYSGVVFAKYLAENLGGYKTIKRIWEIQAEVHNDSLYAIDRAIREKYPQKDLDTEFNRFTACNYNPSQYYKEGSEWETSAATQNTHISYPVARTRGQLDHLASNYQLFKASGERGGKALKLIIDETKGVQWGCKLQRRKQGEKQYDIIEIASNEAYDRSVIIIRNFSEIYDEVCFIPANLDKEQDGVSYSYSAALQ